MTECEELINEYRQFIAENEKTVEKNLRVIRGVSRNIKSLCFVISFLLGGYVTFTMYNGGFEKVMEKLQQLFPSGNNIILPLGIAFVVVTVGGDIVLTCIFNLLAELRKYIRFRDPDSEAVKVQKKYDEYISKLKEPEDK